MSLGELLTYAQRHGFRIGILTNAHYRLATPDGRMVSVEARRGAFRAFSIIEAPGGFAELELACGDLLEVLRAELEEDGA